MTIRSHSLALTALLCSGLAIGLSACDSEESSTGLGERVIPLGQPVPKGGGRYQVGIPYEINGVRYTPKVDTGYDRTGVASWYGELFHGRYTANGEIYDMDRLSAAHPTLPLPIYVHVTNLKNGRSLIVRVNDRGPFRKGRIIDLSKRSAEILGFRQAGTAQVRVRYLRRAPLSGNDSFEQAYLAGRSDVHFASRKEHRDVAQESARHDRSPRSELPPRPDRPERTRMAVNVPKAAPLQEDHTSQSTTVDAVDARAPTSIEEALAVSAFGGASGPSIQAGSFRSKENADRARAVLTEIAPVQVSAVDVAGQTYYRVLVGPFVDGIEAAAAVPLVADAGYREAKIVLPN